MSLFVYTGHVSKITQGRPRTGLALFHCRVGHTNECIGREGSDKAACTRAWQARSAQGELQGGLPRAPRFPLGLAHAPVTCHATQDSLPSPASVPHGSVVP
ncbi:unnamed protein product [Caretta caretta]